MYVENKTKQNQIKTYLNGHRFQLVNFIQFIEFPSFLIIKFVVFFSFICISFYDFHYRGFFFF